MVVQRLNLNTGTRNNVHSQIPLWVRIYLIFDLILTLSKHCVVGVREFMNKMYCWRQILYVKHSRLWGDPKHHKNVLRIFCSACFIYWFSFSHITSRGKKKSIHYWLSLSNNKDFLQPEYWTTSESQTLLAGLRRQSQTLSWQACFRSLFEYLHNYFSPSFTISWLILQGAKIDEAWFASVSDGWCRKWITCFD